jgi:hypothetical protein
MSTQPEWLLPQKPTDLAETQLLAAILDGSFPIGTPLPPERELAHHSASPAPPFVKPFSVLLGMAGSKSDKGNPP